MADKITFTVVKCCRCGAEIDDLGECPNGCQAICNWVTHIEPKLELKQDLIIQYESIKHKGKEYKTADILDGLLAAAQYYSRAGRNTPKTPQNDPNIPVREEMTVAQLRTLLKQGDNDARELVNDLVSELPNQITVWMDKDDARDCADYLSDSQFAEFWYWMRHEWDVLCDFGGRDEIRAALEHWSTICADELDE